MRNKKAINHFPHDCATSRDYRILKLEMEQNFEQEMFNAPLENEERNKD